MAGFSDDLRYGARVLLKTPAFTAVAITTLALAIGANTAIFSVVDTLLLRPLPYPQAGQLVQLKHAYKTGTGSSISIPRFVYWQEQGTPFSAVAAYDDLGSGFNLAGEGPPERVVGSRVSGDFFKVFAVPPALGRGFTAQDERPGAPKVIVLSHRLWQRRFSGDAAVLGKSVVLNDEPYSVVGVAAPTFQFPETAQLWTPLAVDRASNDKAQYLFASARLKDGFTLEKAGAVMDVLRSQLRAAQPDAIDDETRFLVVSLQEHLYGRLRPALWMLLGAVGFVLLIACVNLANLQLARAASRQRELAVRSALGASSRALIRQLLVESVLVSLAGGLAGLALAHWLLPVLVALAPKELRSLAGASVDLRVLGFNFVVSLFTGVLFGLVPALQSANPDLQAALKDGAGRSSAGPSGARTRKVLVLCEVALAMVLLVGAGLLLRTFAHLSNVSPGFEPSGVLTMKLSLSETRYPDAVRLERFFTDVEAKVNALPGVSSSMGTATLPMEGGPDLPYAIEGVYKGPQERTGVGNAQYRPVTPGYFQTLKISLARGRLFTSADKAGSAPVVILNEAAVRESFKGMDPIGQRITIGRPGLPLYEDAMPREVVGVVKDVREDGLSEELPAVAYLPMGQMPPALSKVLVRLLPTSFALRAGGAPESLSRAVENAIHEVDPQQPVTNVLLMDEIVSKSIGAQRFNALLLGALALLALVLAAVGIYGVVSYLVTQRTQEIGVRVALGATRSDVLSLVLRQGLGAVVLGLALGLGGAFAVSRLLESLVQGVSAADPFTFIAAPVVLFAVAVASIYLPARRAAGVDPVIALRAE